MRPFILLFAMILMLTKASAETITITSRGSSQYSIWVPDKTSSTVTFAASELAQYIEQISGAKLPIVTGPVPAKAILVQAVKEAESTRLRGEMYSISLRDGRLYLTGACNRSVLYAVYDFLERLGCRFIAPKFDHYRGSAEYVPKTATLIFTCEAPIVEKPTFLIRKLYVEEGRSHNVDNLAQLIEWMPKARFNTLVIPFDYQGQGRVKWDNWRDKLTPLLQTRDIIIEVGGHGYQNFLNADMEDGTLFETHPEWFGQDENGRRRRDRAYVFCISNHGARRYLIANLMRYLEARPEIQTYALWPPDGASWCQCPGCLSIGSPSDQQAFLLSEVKEALRKARPDVRLEVIAYAKTIEPPRKVKMDSSVLVDFCPIRQCFEKQIFDPSCQQNAEYAAHLRAWRSTFGGDISIYSYYRKYAWLSLPVILPHYIQADLCWYAKIPVQGISSYAEPGDWFTYELNHYILGKLAWNPYLDIDALIRGYTVARYGRSGTIVVQALRVLEDLVRRHCNIPGTALKSPEQLTHADDQLAHVLQSVKREISDCKDHFIKYNLHRFSLTLEYARLDLSIQEARAYERPKEEILKKVRDLASFAGRYANWGIIVHHTRHEEPRIFRNYGIQD